MHSHDGHNTDGKDHSGLQKHGNFQIDFIFILVRIISCQKQKTNMLATSTELTVFQPQTSHTAIKLLFKSLRKWNVPN